ncbi:TIGR00341 family protein [Halorientalis sp. IM1011]|uniref:TIGR00341 family protein n=1 Tax=Halorientalis sp. IM1011 TaxID=1932360 RepID=UPI00097CC5D4|nr:TIGR00341 family protein [Halorientalis sp. IM1011]AQL43159.1 TIGR00341 family protein [Halorientalis sp. IM1011]
MRLLQVTIPTGKRETVLGALDDEGVDYVVTDETSGREFTAIVHVPLPNPAVEPVLERLREAGIDDEAYTVVVEASTVVSRRFEELEDRYAEEEEVDEGRIAREELQTRAEELAPALRIYATMTVISAIIATAGLLLDSPAVVVGSMVIAPLIGPAMAASVGTVLDEQELFNRGVKLQVLGMSLAVVSAAAFAVFVRYAHLIPPGIEITEVPEIRERLAPDFLSLAVALGAGVAGALSLSSGVSAAIVGVMIAVALIPPAATVGIGIAWGLPMVSIGSGVLALVNGLSINVAAIAVLWYNGYRPRHWFRLDEARSAVLKRVAILAVAIAVLSVFLGGVTYNSFQNAETEADIRDGVEGVVAENERATHLDTQVEFTDGILLSRPDRVVVTVGVPPENGEAVGGLAERIDTAVDDGAGHDVRTQVRYVTIEQAD